MEERLHIALEDFKKIIDTAYEKHWKDMDFSYAPPPKVNYKIAKKFAKFIIETSVYCFVDLTTGDIFKPAGWQAPAKHARGNIYSPEHGAEALSGHHIKYLK